MYLLISFASSFDLATGDVYRKRKVFIVLHHRFVSFGTSDNNVALIRVRCQTAASVGLVATRWVSALTLVN